MLKNKKITYLIIGVVILLVFYLFSLSSQELDDFQDEVPRFRSVEREEQKREDPSAEQLLPGYRLGRETVSDFSSPQSSGAFISSIPPSVENAVNEKNKIVNNLPIYVVDFQTSVGLTTTINIFTVEGDPDFAVRVEIYNINFNNTESNPDLNPEVTAFIESVEFAKSEIAKLGVDVNNLYIIFGTRKFMQDTANSWVSIHNLL